MTKNTRNHKPKNQTWGDIVAFLTVGPSHHSTVRFVLQFLSFHAVAPKFLLNPRPGVKLNLTAVKVLP